MPKAFAMNQDKYKVGGRGKALPLEDALAKAKRIYMRTGVFAAVERIVPGRQAGGTKMKKTKKKLKLTTWYDAEFIVARDSREEVTLALVHSEEDSDRRHGAYGPEYQGEKF